MEQLIQAMLLSIIAMIALITLLIYDFLCICRIIKKEEIVEKIWKRILPKKEYNEEKFFVFIRPIFLQISMVMYILSGGRILSEFYIFKMILSFTPMLALAAAIINNEKK